MDISTVTNAYGEKRFTIVGSKAIVVVYSSPVRGLFCVGSDEPITEDLKLLPALSLGMNIAERGYESNQQKMNMVRQAHAASA